MTPEDVNRQLRYMEHIRELSYEAETKAEEARLIREYKQIYAVVKPYLEGKKPYKETPTP